MSFRPRLRVGVQDRRGSDRAGWGDGAPPMTRVDERLTRAEAIRGTEMPFDASLADVQGRELFRPIVQARAGATAHPASEAWPTAGGDAATSRLRAGGAARLGATCALRPGWERTPSTLADGRPKRRLRSRPV